MTPLYQTDQKTFSGNIVEIYEGQEGRFVKILLKPAYLTVPIENSDDIHLGDELKVAMSSLVITLEYSGEKHGGSF